MENEADTLRIAARLEALETRAAHQDRTVEQLNATVTEQWATIDRLQRRLESIQEGLATLEDRTTLPDQQKPPHY